MILLAHGCSPRGFRPQLLLVYCSLEQLCCSVVAKEKQESLMISNSLFLYPFGNRLENQLTPLSRTTTHSSTAVSTGGVNVVSVSLNSGVDDGRRQHQESSSGSDSEEPRWCEIAQNSADVTVIKLCSASSSPVPSNCGDFVSSNPNGEETATVTKIRVNEDQPGNKVSLIVNDDAGVTSISVSGGVGNSAVGHDDVDMVSSSPPPMTPIRCRPGTAQDREKFYLGKIKALQAERNQLRKDAEVEKQKALTATEQLACSLRDSQVKLEALANSLSQVQVAKDDLEYKSSLEKAELDRRLSELKTQSDIWHSECKILSDKCDHLEAELSRSREYAESVESSCVSLKDLAYLWQILDIHDEDAAGGGTSSNSSSGPATADDRPVDKYVRGIRARVLELQKKDAAYQHTLREADRIVADVESRYRSQIADLVTEQTKLVSKVSSLEQINSQLRRHVPKTSGNPLDKEMALLEQLVSVENSNMKLKEQLLDAEKCDRGRSMRILELEREITELKHVLREQDELLGRIDSLQRDNAQLRVDNELLAPVRRQLSDAKAKIRLLEARIDELEETEKSLQGTVERATHLLKSKDDKYLAEIGCLKSRLDGVKQQLEAKEAEAVRWRADAHALKEQLSGKDLEAKRKGDMLHSMEETHRNEALVSRCMGCMTHPIQGKLLNALTNAGVQLPRFPVHLTITFEIADFARDISHRMRETRVTENPMIERLPRSEHVGCPPTGHGKPRLLLHLCLISLPSFAVSNKNSLFINVDLCYIPVIS
ncbi:unnamed protein product [Notodromas monacha]|uniref:Uncharacterized protein n=1 Tax=Notodromas monacha TaxID=399045 RepID=A0A7R9BTZ4_9CRUS|nr:unnamed protein product [Notodromas monacha]CAG0920151.1 unnamed protein product [Notodromas monacha]